MSPFSLKDKVICITGASSGIGRQCAVSCSQMGATVVLMARNEERLCETLSAMENPDKHMMVPVDLTEYAQVGLAVKDIVNKAGSDTIQETITFHIDGFYTFSYEEPPHFLLF